MIWWYQYIFLDTHNNSLIKQDAQHQLWLSCCSMRNIKLYAIVASSGSFEVKDDWTNLETKNIFVYRHPWVRDNRLGTMDARSWILGVKFLLVFFSNYGSVSHRLGAIGNCTPLWHHQGQRWKRLSINLDVKNILGIGYRQPFRCCGWSIIVVTFILTLQGHISCRIWNSWYPSSY